MTKEQYKRASSEYRQMLNGAKYHNDAFLFEVAEGYNPEKTINHQQIIHEWYRAWMSEEVL